jgi:recombinational DNA repair protein (RecF pathway)
MSHAIHHTQALIVKTKNISESNKLVYLYTEKFGLIYASMQSLRELRSKMRYHIHAYSLVDVDVVQGKSIWRITGVHEIVSGFSVVNTPWYRLQSLVCDMIQRLCAGEEQNQALWNDVVLLFKKIEDEQHHYHDMYEYIIIVRILYHLGYWSEYDIVINTENPYTHDIIQHVEQKKVEYIQNINTALAESQL